MDLQLVRSGGLRIDMAGSDLLLDRMLDPDRRRASRGGERCPRSRADLREAVDAAGVGERVVIPADGERLRR